MLFMVMIGKKDHRQKVEKKLISIMKNWKGKVIDVPYTKKISSTIIKSHIKKNGKSTS